MSDTNYPGDELHGFAMAKNWRNYWARFFLPHLCGSVLEVGAGIGSVTRHLRPASESWTAVEPDAELVAESVRMGWPAETELRVGTLRSIRNDETFDSILYIDVLEHIEDDEVELQQAAQHLNIGGHLLVLVPAHDRLYSPFDVAVGHFRRYGRRDLLGKAPPRLKPVMLSFLDCFGLAMSYVNSRVLHESHASPRVLRFWDSCLIPLSRLTDPLMGYRVGKSIVAVWRKDSSS